MDNKKERVLILTVCALTIITGVIMPATVLAQVYSSVDPAFDQSTMFLALVESGSAGNETLSIRVFASPSEVQSGKECEIKVIVSNVAARRVDDISLTVITPSSWTAEILVAAQSSLEIGESTRDRSIVCYGV